MGRRPSSQALADQLAARAMSYAEQQIEAVELAELSDRILEEMARADVGGAWRNERAIVETKNMEIITSALARAFVHGYAAKLDDAKPVEALGGLAEQRRKGRRGG